MLTELSRPLAVVAHDAGGANQILAQLQASTLPVEAIRACVQGPARTLWERVFPDTPKFDTVEQALAGSQQLLAGTGWASHLEHRALSLARELSIPSVALLDHWVHYPERFTRAGQTSWPDEFWVVDDYAMKLAQQAFPGQVVRQVPDHYLQTQTARISAPPDTSTLLYVLEPTRDDWGRGQPGEFQALEYLLASLPRLHLPAHLRIVLRPHPSETHDKYQHWVDRQKSYHVVFDASASLAEALSDSYWVAGCESYALVVALAAGRTVFGTLPPWAPTCRLPHQGLIHLKHLLT